MSANDRQIGGDHYKKHGDTGEQHWDRQYRLFGPGYFVGCATKYIERYRDKNGKQDLEKAIHFIQKLIELEYPVTGGELPSDGPFNPEHAPLASFPQVKPTGWVGFVFEGMSLTDCLFTCRSCNAKIWTKADVDPITQHSCEGVQRVRYDVQSG